MCYDSKQNQLVIPMNANNALAFIPCTASLMVNEIFSAVLR